MLKIAVGEAAREDLAAGLDEIVREGARGMLAAGLEEGVAGCVAAHAAERDGDGQRLMVGNGHARPRQVTMVARAVVFRLIGAAGGGWCCVGGRAWLPWSGPGPGPGKESSPGGRTGQG